MAQSAEPFGSAIAKIVIDKLLIAGIILLLGHFASRALEAYKTREVFASRLAEKRLEATANAWELANDADARIRGLRVKNPLRGFSSIDSARKAFEERGRLDERLLQRAKILSETARRRKRDAAGVIPMVGQVELAAAEREERILYLPEWAALDSVGRYLDRNQFWIRPDDVQAIRQFLTESATLLAALAAERTSFWMDAKDSVESAQVRVDSLRRSLQQVRTNLFRELDQ
jgi:hypothetical protein